MGKIKCLSDSLVAKIAAGEVIERPAYAVKEVIENAIDAGADSIDISVEESGLAKITITDNGEGIEKDDILLCFLRHATSKIADETDLLSIKSFGFRGEALSSIAAISKITIMSRPAGDTVGMSVTVDAGEVTNTVPIGMPPGTRILIENLFYSVPARRKFLKGISTESRHITEVITGFALAYPGIRFIYSHNGNLIFDFPKDEIVSQRLQSVLKSTISSQLVPVNFEKSYLKISGFISRPQLATHTTQKQYIFVNKRRIIDKSIAFTVKTAYGTLLEQSLSPVFVLFIELPYDMVDVNVHPRKEQIDFHEPRFILDAIETSVKDSLITNNLTYFDQRWKGDAGSSEEGGKMVLKDGLTKSFAGKLLKNQMSIWDMRSIGKFKKSGDIIQMHNLYIITQTEKGILIIDQHAAHERILFEQFRKSYLEGKKTVKLHKLSKQRIIELSALESEVLIEHLGIFSQMGFTIEPFGGTSFKITAIPFLLKDRNIQEFISEMIDDLIEEGKIRDIDRKTQKMLAYLACRSAVKQGEPLTKKECKRLLLKLAKTNSQYTCPHGRPVQVEVSLRQLHLLFKRIK